jgi:hypothetical protein
MKCRIIGIVLLGGLIACGRSDQPASTGNGAPVGTQKMMWIPGTDSTPFPTPTAYVPTVHGNIVELNTTIAGSRSQMPLRMQRNQVLHLTASIDTFPYFEWSIEFDPQLFGASVGGKPYQASQGFEPYPPNGRVLTPLQAGTYPLTIQLRLDPCENCDTVSHYTVYRITIE